MIGSSRLSSGPLGLGLVLLGHVEEAEVHLTAALPILRELRDWKWVVNTLLGLALIARRRRDLIGALARHYADAASLCQDWGDVGNLPLAFEGMAATAAASGNSRAAADHARRSRENGARLGRSADPARL